MKYPYILLFSMFFLGCTKKQARIPIEGKIGVALHGNGPLIYAQTIELYGSGGYRIQSVVRKKSKELHIEFKHVLAPEAGFTVLSPADVYLALPNLPDGTHRVVFTLNDQQTNATLFLGETDSLDIGTGGEVIAF
jgi:hypothetical protein